MKAIARRATSLVFIVSVLTFLVGASHSARALEVKTTQNTDRLMSYQVFELTFQHEGQYRSPLWDVTIDVTFTSPSGKAVTVGGFFYGSSKPQTPVVKPTTGRGPSVAVWPCDPGDLWKARFAPSEPGDWKFSYVFGNDKDERATGTGSFQVVAGRVHQRGFLRISSGNAYRFAFDDGSPFFPVGFQDGIQDGNHNGSGIDVFATEGPFRPDPNGQRPKPPAGAMFARGPSMGPQNGDVHFGLCARAGFNLWRFSPNNVTIKVFARDDNANTATLDNVRWEEARMVDELLQTTRKYGMCNFYGLFGYTGVAAGRPTDAQTMAKVKRLIKYSVDRWGAYVDIWEFLNEQKADAGWYEIMVPYLKSVDPYQHPITTSWERPELAGIQINAPHWYGNEDELVSDQAVVGRANRDKRFGKPVVYGEQGNSRGKDDRTAEGIGGVWDPGSARRMRVRLWSALFNEVSLVFWETSYAKDGHYMNLWIGPEERQYVHALQDFASQLDAGVKMVKPELGGPSVRQVRAYGLRSDRTAAVYLHHFRCAECQRIAAQGGQAKHLWSHDRGEVRDLAVTVDVPRAATGYWYNPVDGSILGRFDAPAGRQTVTAPAFTVDLALIMTELAPPDSDHDGQPNDVDVDDDNDGVPDLEDAFPLEREEWVDVDGDRIGDNLDADIDADGVADDLNKNGVSDNQELDWDGDGVPNAAAVPWDAFPRDPKEWKDTDGDGIGDNADADDDGDGYTDQEELQAGTNPLDALSFPR